MFFLLRRQSRNLNSPARDVDIYTLSWQTCQYAIEQRVRDLVPPNLPEQSQPGRQSLPYLYKPADRSHCAHHRCAQI